MRLNRIMWKEDEKFKVMLSIMILFLAGIIFYIIQYYQLLLGDDVLFQYENSHYCYTGLKQWGPDEKITNLSMMIDEVWARWKYFSGRFSTVVLVPLLNILGQKICSVMGSIVYVLVIICIGRVIWGSWKEIFRHPLGLLCIYLLQFHLSPTASYMQMWTFVCHYSMPLVLCLLYYVFWMEYTKKQLTMKWLVALNVFGVYVGATHELLPLYCFILIGIRGIMIYKKQFFKPLALSNIGILLGYLFVVVAPGNLIRMGIDHDKRRMETGIKEKIWISLNAHIQALGLENLIVKIFLITAIIIIGYAGYRNRSKIKENILDNLEFVVAAALSIILWAIVAPPVAQYSLPFFKAIVVILFFRMIDIEIKFSSKYVAFVSAMVLVFVFTNVAWCKDLIDVATYRRYQIEVAKEENKSEVVLVNYPESTANYFTDDNMGNIPGIYDTETNTDFYGIRLITVEN